jgi:hypothetical protein
MRILRFGISYVLVNIFAVLVAALLAQNAHGEHLAYFGVNVAVNMAWILLGAATFGFVLALLLLIPGRIAVGFHAWGLDREAAQLEQQVALLRDQREELLDRHEALMEGQERTLRRYHQLLAEHKEVMAERDRVRAQLGRMSAVSPEGVEEASRIPTVGQEGRSVATVPTPVDTSVAQPSLSRRLLPAALVS